MSDTNTIAIVGMACQFPGAPDLAAFWDLIAAGREGMSGFGDAELADRGVPAALRQHRNYVPVGGIIDGQDRFDPDHFGFTPTEAALLDPQLRLLLECAWNALGDAGHGGGAGLGTVGVFSGASHSDYLDKNLARYRREADHDPMGHLQATMGAITDYFPQQIAYRLGLTGPAVAVQATCATSLVAVHMAAQSLLLGECDSALAGGVSLIVPQGRGYLHVPDSIFSADGHTRAFGADGSGMVHSQGVGVVVLRRLDEALADGDPIYAVLRGSAVNHDGAGKAGFTAPSATGQARVVAEALAVADVDVDAVGLIEAHGTATALGDQIELSALAAVFGKRSAPEPIALSSVKSNIGHTNTAAGIASLIKTSLALRHQRIPATLHADPAHPELAQHRGLLEVPDRTRAWPEHQGTRIAGVSSFGIGGTNCHVVLEQSTAATPAAPDRRAQLLVMSGAEEQACRSQLDLAAATVDERNRADYAYTALRAAHRDSGWRAAAILPENGGAPRQVTSRKLPARRPAVVFAFPGAGAQYPGMGAGLYRDEPVFAAAVDECAAAMQPLLGYDIRDIITGSAPHRDADDVRYGQPALFAVSLATAMTLRGFGIEPDGVLGHSLGEYAAAVVAGMLSASDAARLVAVRSLALADAAPGAMLAVASSEPQVADLLTDHPSVTLAAINATDSYVVSGPAVAIDELAAALAHKEVGTSRLRIDAALHSPAVEDAVAALREVAASVPTAPAALPLYSTLTGQAVDTVDAEHWARHLREPVRFAAALHTAVTTRPTTLVQVGPGGTLASLARRNAPSGLAAALSTLPDADEIAALPVDTPPPDRGALLAAIGQLWCDGAELAPDALHRRRQRVRLPGYPFHRRRFWIDPPADSELSAAETLSSDGAVASRTMEPPLSDPVPSAVPSGDTGSATRDEQSVAALWSELLGRPVNDPEDDFFALGGSSMQATRMLDILNAREETDIRLRELLASPTLSAFAELLSQRRTPTDHPDPTLRPTEPEYGRPNEFPNDSAPSDVEREGLGADTAVTPEDGAANTPAPEAELEVLDAGAPGSFPLTRVQHAYWVGRSGAFGLSDTACHIYLEYDCGSIDLDRYQQAWNRVIQRHDMLRAVVGDDGRNHVLDTVPEYRIRRHDLTDMAAEQREETLAELRRQLSHRVHRPDRWPLFDVRAAALDDSTVRLFFGIDALICDAGSFLVLDRDLRRSYHDPAAPLPPVRTGFADYVAHLATRADSLDRRRSVDYWQQRMQRIPGPPTLPTRTRTQTRPWFARRSGELSAPEWAALRRLAAEHGVTPSAVLLTAYADVLAAWSGDDRFSVMLTLIDRPVALPGIDDVVGDFTTLLAHEVDRTDSDSFAERVGRTQRQLFDDIDHRDYSALELLSEMSSSTGQRQLLPVVFTSALDAAELTGAEPDLEWAGRIVHGVSQTPQLWLDHQAFMQAGALQLQWDVLETVLDPDGADTAFAAYVAWLRQLVHDPDAWRADNTGPRLTAPGEDVTAAVAAIWTQVLGVDTATVQPDSTFVGLGGDSVLAVRMATMVRGRLGVAVPVVDLVGDLTLAQLADTIAERRGESTAVRGSELVRQEDPTAPFPLTPLQQAYWVGQQDGWALSYSSAHNYVDFRLAGIDPTAVQAAVRRQVQRQPMLRAVFLADGVQQVLAEDDPRLAVLPITELDLRAASVGDIDRTLADTRAEMRSTGPGMDPWPFRITAVRLPGDELSLHIVCSLLVADGWSVQLMFTELFTYLDEPNTVLPPLTAHFGDYVETINRQRHEPEWLAQRDWWWERLDELPTAPALPLAIPFEQARPDAMERRELRVSGERMTVLRERCAEYGITPTTMFATCYSAALARMAGHRRFLLNVLYLNRLHLPADLDHAIGPYAGTVLMDVALPAAPTFVAAARHVQEATGRMLDHGQVTGVEVVRELGRRRRDTSPQAPVVFHSTLGLHPPGGTPAAVRVSDFYQRLRTPQVALDMQVFQWDWDDSVVVNLDAVAELFSAGVLDDLFADISAGIDALVERPEAWSELVTLPAPELPDRHGSGRAPTAVSGPPTTATEKAIADLWADMLETDPTDFDRAADFFAGGGDSVIAIRMLRRLRTELGLIVTPRDFLADPTLAAIAATADTAAGDGDADCAVTLRDGTGDPLFMLHPTGGDVLCYVELARKLDTRRPVIGIQDPALGRDGGSGSTAEQPASIADLARRYERVLRAQQPRGPYYLGGWSMGGIVAHEVARRLRAAGEEVAVLALIDANIADRIRHTADGREFWSRYLGSLEAFLEIDLESHSLDAAFDRLSESQQHDEVTRRLTAAGLAVGGDPETLRHRADVFRRHLRALGDHRTGLLDDVAETLLVRASLLSPRNSGVGMGVDDCADLPDLGWGEHTPGLITTHQVEAHHYALLREPAVDVVARVLSEAVRRIDLANGDRR
ncbi:condensation domain-containing protein [Nocardia sp. NPDC023852]|uniref:condensation domain-containing protein n=1 Tax=Nocardia sp. NPDC023852 TaxID=3154697 RepID=UPI0033E82242